MSNVGLTTSQISAAGAYAQADRLAVSIPVRPVDPTRRRFQVEDQATAQDAPAEAQSGTESTEGEASSAGQGKSGSGFGTSGFGLIGAVTSFLARLFGQAEGDPAGTTTSVRSGAQAYARAAATVTEDNGTEVLSPSYPRLASGRAVDLTV